MTLLLVFLASFTMAITGIFDNFEGELTLEAVSAMSVLEPQGLKVLIYGICRRLPVEVIDHVIGRGTFDVNALDNLGSSSLNYALEAEDIPAANALLRHGADWTGVDVEYLSSRSTEVFRFVWQNGVDVCRFNGFLAELIVLENSESIELALEIGCSVNETTDEGLTPLMALHSQDSKADPKLVNELLRRGAKIDEAGFDGRNCLYYAVKRQFEKLGRDYVIDPEDLEPIMYLIERAGLKAHAMLHTESRFKVSALDLLMKLRDREGHSYYDVIKAMSNPHYTQLLNYALDNELK